MKFSTRSAFKIGDSRAVSLPPEWVNSHKELVSVTIVYDIGGAIIVFASDTPPEEIFKLSEKAKNVTIEKILKELRKKK